MEILEFLINLDFKYYTKNRKVYNFVKIYDIGVSLYQDPPNDVFRLY